MLDFNNIVTNVKSDQQVFNPSGVNWQTWKKPRGINFVHVFCIGGGGGGRAGEAADPPHGGIGGGGAATSTALFPAWALPDTLFIQVGAGGAGGTRGVNPTGGGASIIALWPSETTPTTNNLLLRASGGSFSPSGLAAPSASANTVAASNLASIGVVKFVAGVGSTDRSTSQYSFSPNFVGQGGGRGGDGKNTNNTPGDPGQQYVYGLGQGFNQTVDAPVGAGGAAADGAAGRGGDGTSGFVLFPGLSYMSGGTGGGGAGRATLADANGGNGGNGGIGCGGGGGGGNFAGSFPGSRGGNGGPGLVIITSW
jgi:hypothetical protein